MKTKTKIIAEREVQLLAKPDHQNLIIIFTAVFLLVCISIFLTNRTNDIGQLGALLGSFLRSTATAPLMKLPVVGAKLLASFIAMSVVLAWFGFGTKLTQWFGFDEPTETGWTRFGLATSLGAAMSSFVWFWCGTLHAFNKFSALLLLGIGCGCGLHTLIRNRATFRSQTNLKFDVVAQGAVALIIVVVGLTFLQSLAPVTGKDAMVYRLAIPQQFVDAGGFSAVGTNIFGYLALGAEMNGIWGLLLGQMSSSAVAETSFALILFAYFPLLLITIYHLAWQWTQQHIWAVVCAGLVACIPTLALVAGASYVDHVLTLYVVLSLGAFVEWYKNPTQKMAMLTALFLGAALSVKLIALFVFVPLGIIALFKMREVQTDTKAVQMLLLQNVLVFGGALLLALPWFARTWVMTGSPVYPFYAHFWRGNALGWDAARSSLTQILFATYGGAQKGIFDYLLTPFKITLQAQPELPKFYDGVIGLTGLIALPLLGWAVWKRPVRIETKLTAAVAAGWYFCWLFTSQQLRFLLPGLVLLLLAFVSVLAAELQDKSALRFGWGAIALFSALPGLLVILAWFLEANPVRVILGGEVPQQYLARRLDYYSYYDFIHQTLPPNAKIWLINMRNDTIHLQRQSFADYVFEDYTLTQLVKESNSLDDLRAKIKAMGISHLLVRHDLLLDYARTPIVDERKTEPENRAKFRLLNALFTERAKVLKSDTKFMLLEL